ncbi:MULTISPECIES: STAS domain-containing protein [Methylobacterium]|jgi:SulP family sulfate permease|uniref:Sulfate transporter YbaR n=1 Tax=Methylobacterium oryzae CBMB20 TaxID=693986 RepID=A0A089NZN2_9HYPH|nr:Putative sulfate transporter YbaR [Methylobacterium oryzae CBMB20]SFU96400.1 sulfate permease, SulP family [Methylobacterium sp. UNCCL125]
MSAFDALDRVVRTFRRHGIALPVVGMNAATASRVERIGPHDKPGAACAVGGP